MTVTSTSTSTNPLTSSSTTSTASGVSNSAANTDPAASQDRFLKLLVAQLNNQDPMNPMDNAQMTSQMAQINTVTGIQQLNQTMKSLQVLQGASVVGHDVLTDGNTLTLNGQTGKGGMDLSGPASAVKVEILDAGGKTVDTLNLGPKDAGRVMFDWTAPASVTTKNFTFNVTATQGSADVATAPLTQNKVLSVSLDNGAMSLALQNQKTVAYANVRAIL